MVTGGGLGVLPASGPGCEQIISIAAIVSAHIFSLSVEDIPRFYGVGATADATGAGGIATAPGIAATATCNCGR